ncbi:LPS export ABC transporter periplasmic protein LptC [Aliiruegeria sabulilitoris]|uniref:LPS export ABC transporter periplasmic protein LptC n=1 Tax=Aliiruegeria sabulilitoris TaxID=1510458 RepID=UPI00082A81AD|nr:LPS export ABC transporter periplasmic protein LptC [Aliiruegeria sabulilitoris]NDR57458.1 hypothetical protein [Pseudoruegeria sp. M32A2M]
MASQDNLHSRIVGWLKIILPLSALALLSSVFLVARFKEHGGTIPYSKIALKELASVQTVEDPVFTSVTDEGQHVVVTAKEATPRDGDYNVVDAVGVHGTLRETDGETINIWSDAGTVFSAESRTILQGNVRIETSSGYNLFTDELISAVDRTDIESPGPVHGEGPLGTIEAGRMEVTSQQTAEGTEEKVTVVFKDGVKVIYTPQTQ